MNKAVTNDYDEYLNSREWREKADRIRKRDGRTCCVCGAANVPLEVHHLTYDRLFDERDDDLLTVCHDCHEGITCSWHSINDGIGAYRKFARLVRSCQRAHEMAEYINALMPHDICFGGEYVLTGYENIKTACKDMGIEPKYLSEINTLFNQLHIIDVVNRLNSGRSRQEITALGYPSSLMREIADRQKKNDGIVRNVSDALVCFMHEGNGKWIVTAVEDGLDTKFVIRFMPSIRYADRWWDNG